MKTFGIFFLIASASGLLNPNEFPCGTFRKYDTVNGVNDPALYGLFGGVNFDGTDEFIGYGNNTNCNQIPSSGFISTGTSLYGNQGAGAYLPCGSGISFDKVNAHYLLKNSQLEWVATDNAAMFTVPNVLKIVGNLEFAFGRVYREGKYRVGKLHFDLANEGIYIQLANGTEECYESGFEILTCCKEETTTKIVKSTTTKLTTTVPTTLSTTTSTTTVPTTLSTTTSSKPPVTIESTTKTSSTTKAPTVSSTTQTTTSTTTSRPQTVSSTTTFNPLKYSCGTFIKFDAFNGKNDPNIFGVLAGVNYDDSAQYVGYGFNDKCNENNSPGFISSGTSTFAAGAFMPCIHGHAFDSQRASYLLENPNLKWVSTSIFEVSSIVGVIKSGQYAFGRVKIDGKFRVGKVNQPQGGFYVQYKNNTEMVFKDGFEVLTCCTEQATKAPIFDVCGTFSKFSSVNELNFNGYQAGVNYDNSPEFIGYGNNKNCNENPSAGYISTGTSLYGNQGPGAYMTCKHGISFDKVDAHYLNKNSELEWIATDRNLMREVPNTVKTHDKQMAWGRIKDQGQYRVGKVNLKHGGFFVQWPNNTEKCYDQSSFEILTCARGARLYENNCLYVGDGLISDKNCFRMLLQSDGNLVVYRQIDNKQVWSTGTNGKASHKACMQEDGNFVIYDQENGALWSTGTHKKSGKFVYLQDDAQLTIRGEGDATIWVNGRVEDCSGPCGTFARFDAENLASTGFLAGFNYDNTQQFIGYGNNHNCGENPSAGFASLGSSLFGNQGAGVYHHCRNGLYVDKQNPFFLLNHPKLKFVNADFKNFKSVPNLLLTSDKRWAWGRIMDKGQYRVGRVDLLYFNGFFVQTPDNVEKKFETNFEILTCSP